MTASTRIARPVDTIEDACEVLRQGGGRVSVARRAILAVLLAAEVPMSAEAIAVAADPALDVPTTYRNLDRLGALGLVRHLHLGHGPGLYEVPTASDREYGLCDDCGVVVVVPSEALDHVRQQVLELTGIRPEFSHFPFTGRCQKCCDEGHARFTRR